MAYEFSMALRASCALVPRMTLAHGVLPRIEDALPAIGAPKVYFHPHTRGMYPRHPSVEPNARRNPVRSTFPIEMLAGIDVETGSDARTVSLSDPPAYRYRAAL
jgi:hypothetical protein